MRFKPFKPSHPLFRMLQFFRGLCLGILCLGLIWPTLAQADDPFLSDNAEVLIPHQQYIVLYSFYNQYHFGKSIQAPAVEFDFNVFPNFEVDTFTPIVSVFDSTAFPNLALHDESQQGPHSHKVDAPNATGIGDINIELKYRFIQETTYIPQVAFGPNFFLPTGDYYRGLGNGRFYYFPGLTAQKNHWLLAIIWINRLRR